MEIKFTRDIVTGEDLAAILDGSKTSSNVIDSYLELLILDEPNKTALPASVYCYIQSGQFSLAQSWFLAAEKHKLALMPLCSKDHWTLAAIDFETKTVKLYNSLKRGTKTALNPIKRFMKTFRPDSQWDYRWSSRHILQHNDKDCGIFVTQFARCVVRERRDIRFCFSDIPDIRETVAEELIKKTLMEMAYEKKYN